MSGDRLDERQQAESPQPERDIARELRLRPERPRVLRLSRKVLAGLGGLSMLALGAALIWALHTEKPRTGGNELYNTENKTTAEGLSRLPRDYSELPRAAPPLGPPLPGDLGRPMLKAGVPPPLPGAPAPSQPDPEAQRLAQERQRVEQEKEAARVSRLFATTTVQPASAAPVSSDSAAAPGLPGPSDQTGFDAFGGPGSEPTNAEGKLAFLNGPIDRRIATPDHMQPPASPYVLQAGAVIAAALVTGLRSDLPGQVVAQVTENVYDSPTGRILLIPQGSRVIGQYDAQVSFGQSRALLVWTRLILPNGRSIVLERQPGADPAGHAGLEDEVDNHWGQVFKAALVSTLLGIGSAVGVGSGEDELARAIRRGASDSVSQTGGQVVGRSLGVQPTLTVRPGFPVRMIVTRDLILEPYRN